MGVERSINWASITIMAALQTEDQHVQALLLLMEKSLRDEQDASCVLHAIQTSLFATPAMVLFISTTHKSLHQPIHEF